MHDIATAPDQATQWKSRAAAWFQTLRDQICAAFEALEDAQTTGPFADLAPGRFERKETHRDGGGGDAGGGVMSVLRGGRCFEKVGVNISTVYGTLGAQAQRSLTARREIPGLGDDPRFWASGISLVAHMRSPKCPAVHMNTRMFWTPGAWWFGGGTDLNPMVEEPADTAAFHGVLKAACDRHDAGYYPRYKAWADDYFMIRHWNEPRGVGGIFYDDHCTQDWEADFAFTQDVGRAFLDAWVPLTRAHMAKDWTEADRAHQLVRRGRYAEFNLVYDRGTPLWAGNRAQPGGCADEPAARGHLALNRLDILQAGRALAALAVVLHHAGQGTRAFVAPLPPLVDTLAMHGYLGVDFFFVLSGFLIWTVGAGRDAGAFVRARLIRVFGPYLPVGLGLALAYTLLPGLSASGREWGWGASLTLLPFAAPPALSVGWTLQHELVFYLWFALLLWLRALGPGLAVWGLAILGLAAWGGIGVRPLAILFSPLNLEFLMGVGAALAVDRRLPSWVFWLIAALGFGGFVALGAAEPLSPLAGLGFAGLIVPLVRAERARTLRVPGALVSLGDASFALYLVHNPLISLTSRFCADTGNWALALGVALIAALAAGLAYHHLVERPILAQTRKLFMRDISIGADHATF